MERTLENIEPVVNIWLSESLTFLVTVALIYWSIKKIQTKDVRERKEAVRIFRNIVILFILIWLLPGVYGFVSFVLIPVSYNEAFVNYNDFMDQHSFYDLVPVFFTIILYLFLVIMFFRMSITVRGNSEK